MAAVYCAIKAKRYAKALELLNSGDIDVNYKYNGIPLLAYAINVDSKKMDAICVKLIELGADDHTYMNDDDETMLMIAIRNELVATARKLYDANKVNRTHINKDGSSALLYACCNKNMADIAKLLVSDDIDGKMICTIPTKPEYEELSILMLACRCRTDVTLSIIESGKSNPEYIHKIAGTILTTMILQYYTNKDEREMIARALIATGKSIPEYIYNGRTILMLACRNIMPATALALIATGKSNPGYIDDNGNTALIDACSHPKLKAVAKAIIATGQSKPEYINNAGNTALIASCYPDNVSVSLALIATGKSNPGHANNDGNTALIYACMRKIPKVAIALIETGQSNPRQIACDDNTALTYAEQNGMTQVIEALEDV